MAYTQLEDLGEVSLRNLLNFPNLDTPTYYPIMLFVIFLVFTFGTFFREMKREGKANMLSSLAVGGFVTSVIAILFSLLDLIQREVLIAVIVISLIFEVIYLLPNRD